MINHHDYIIFAKQLNSICLLLYINSDHQVRDVSHVILEVIAFSKANSKSVTIVLPLKEKIDTMMSRMVNMSIFT